jgi:5-methylcytosine-specific restriction endonuclease McrA
MKEDPDAVRAQRRAWAKTSKGRLANRAARSARRGAAYTPESLAWIQSLKNPRCEYCGAPATEIDHVIPISLGGTGERQNLVPACRACNAAKNDLPLEEFIGEP